MKFSIVLALATACVCAEDDKKDSPLNNLIEEWKAVYGKYGVDAYIPIDGLRYSYPLAPTSYPLVPTSYPLVQPAYPAYQVVAPTYPAKPVISYPPRVKASYDPEYFSQLYGYYPEH